MLSMRKLKKIVSVIAVTTMMFTGVTLGNGKNITANAQVNAASTSSIPSHVLVGYWHNFSNGAGSIKLRDVSPNYDVINLSFGEPTNPTSGDVRFTPFNATDDEFISDVKYLQSKGKKVLLSIGGEKGEVQLNDAAALSKFVSTVSGIVDKYGLDGLDVDFEGQSLHLNSGDKDFKNPTTPVIVNTISALKQLKAKYGDNFVLTMAPETFFVQLGHTYYGGLNSYVDSRAGAFLPVIYGVRDILSWLQVQYYNSGTIYDINGKSQSMGNGEFYASLTDMLLTGFNVNNDPNYFFPALRQDQVVIGVPSNSYAGNGYASNAEVKSALDGLMNGGTVGGYTVKNKYPNLRGLMTWSINWDQYSNLGWSNYFRNYFNGTTPPVNSLTAATLSSSAVVNGSYTLSASVPANNSATSYKILEGQSVISSGSLTPGQNTQTVNYNVTAKGAGTYNYTIALSDGTSSVNSNVISVVVPAPIVNTLQAATLSAGTVNNGAYTLTSKIPANNSATSYKILEGQTVISSGNLTVGQGIQTINYNVTGKTAGTYSYNVSLSDGSSAVVSNTVNVVVPTQVVNTLQAASISSSNTSVTNGSYTLSAVVPGNNTATSYKIYEGTTVVSSGSLVAGSAQKTITFALSNKADGNYDYTIVLSDSTNSLTSNKITVTVKNAVVSNAWVAYHAYKTGEIVTYNGSSYKCVQGHTSLNGWEPSNVPALWQKI